MTNSMMLMLIATVVLGMASADVGACAEWDVNPGGSIQTTIDGAGAGDTIYVHAGAYDENVDVDKQLTLIGDGADVVTVRAASEDDHIFEVTADWVNISGFTVTGATYGCWNAGFYLGGVDHCNISDNNASNSVYGILLKSSSDNNNLTDNNASNNKFGGIRLVHSSNNTLQNNAANSNDGWCGGIYLDSSNNNTLTSNKANSNNECGICMSGDNNTLTSNTMSINKYNFGVGGDSLSDYTQNIDTSNTVDGKPIYYWVDQQDKQIPCDAGFVGIVNSTNITVKNLTLTNNTRGVLFAYTDNSKIENITITSDGDGIYLWSSSDNMLQNNSASNNGNGISLGYSNNNTLQKNNASNNNNGICLHQSSSNILANNTASNNGWGICLGNSNNNTLSDNNASNNGIGIYLQDSDDNTLTSNIAFDNNCGIELYLLSDDNTFYYNNLIDNTQNAYDSCTNQWDSGSEGNYWSNYTGNDINGDGIGDDQRPIPGGSNEDRYPLMEPYSPPTGPQDKSLLQVEGQPKIYWLQNNKLYWVTDWDVINNMTGVPGWNSVNTLPSSEFDPSAYPQGPRFITTGIESDNLLIREQGDIKVYLILGGKKHHFTSPEALTWNGYGFDDVIEVSSSIIKMFPEGTPISNEIISISSATVDVNDIIVLPVSIANATNIQQMTLDLVYDTDVVTIMNITANDAIPLSTITYTIDSGNATIELNNPDNITVATATPLIDIAFQTGENTGTTALELQNVELTDAIGPHTPTTIVNGSITVCIKGDFNYNDRVDIGDAAKVAFMVAGKVTPDQRADFNNNGRVDVGDAAKISFYLAQKVNEL